ncbi:hypothetical protein MKEN_00504200 [Mycena kentingensis (nom. inval.)]|nr:hypothetical protein MKEN_00504200 [Mycena kentingensis (nom. inval.)]
MFSFKSAVIIALASVITNAHASPAARQTATCNPNFEGAGVSIIAGGTEWGVSPVAAGTELERNLESPPLNATAEWHVEQMGSAVPSYIIKAISNNGLVVDGETNGLFLQQIDASKPTQIWDIDCKKCVQGAASAPQGGELPPTLALPSPFRPPGPVDELPAPPRPFCAQLCSRFNFLHWKRWPKTTYTWVDDHDFAMTYTPLDFIERSERMIFGYGIDETKLFQQTLTFLNASTTSVNASLEFNGAHPIFAQPADT